MAGEITISPPCFCRNLNFGIQTLMNISVILAHPNKESFNHAIAHAAVETLTQLRHTIFFHDLYGENFPSLLPYEEFEKDADIPPEIQIYCDEISVSDGIIIIHPNWWGQPPSVLKGWVDRVIRPGVAYEFLDDDSGEGIAVGLLKARAAVVFNTGNTPLEREMNVFGDPLETLWDTCIFGFCGIEVFHRKLFQVIVTSSLEQRQKWLEEVRETVLQYFGVS